MPDPPPGPAIGAPAAARALRRSVRVAQGTLALAVVVLLVAATMWWHDRAAADLQRTGTQASATVTAVHAVAVGRARNPDGSVVVTYEVGGRTEARSVYVGGAVGRFRAGQSVTIVFDPAAPTKVEVLGVGPQREGPPTLLVAGVGAIVVGVAVHLFRRARRLLRLLRAEPWLAVAARLTDVEVTLRGRRRMATLLWLAPPEGHAVMAMPAGLDRLALSFEPTVWTVRLGDERFVVAPPGGAPIRWMRSVH